LFKAGSSGETTDLYFEVVGSNFGYGTEYSFVVSLKQSRQMPE
jgi:hypothetical protein